MRGLKEGKSAPGPKGLVDTHTLVWALATSDPLSAGARRADPLPWREKFIMRAGIPLIGIRQSQMMALGQLQEHHRDAIDRILVAQAKSKDRNLAACGIPVVWSEVLRAGTAGFEPFLYRGKEALLRD